jgi:hypothetical protein
LGMPTPEIGLPAAVDAAVGAAAGAGAGVPAPPHAVNSTAAHVERAGRTRDGDMGILREEIVAPTAMHRSSRAFRSFGCPR